MRLDGVLSNPLQRLKRSQDTITNKQAVSIKYFFAAFAFAKSQIPHKSTDACKNKITKSYVDERFLHTFNIFTVLHQL
jgi:hypothetical protein